MAAPTPIRAKFHAFELDEANARLWRDGRAVPMAPKPFALLCALVRAPGSLLSKHQLLDEVWGHQFVSDSVLKTAISEIRAALGDDPKRPRLVETVSRRGYRFIGPVTTPSARPPSQPGVQAMATSSGSSFVGRGAALARLHEAWTSACRGSRQLVWIAGEPGIGKTALIEQFTTSLTEATCALGQCVEFYGSSEPYLPVLEAVAEICRRDESVPVLMRSVAPTWLVQMPWLCTEAERERLRLELTGVGPERMLREMNELLGRYTADRPLLLVTEDLQWSDRATLQLIDYIARRRGHLPLMWLASYRLNDVVDLEHPFNATRRELRLHEMCEEIVLEPFSEAEVAEFIAARAPELAGSEDFVRALHERSDGVPLFVTSIVRQVLAGRERQGAGDAVDIVRTAVPENLAGVIEHHVSQLDELQREVLSAASVCGMEFGARTVAAAVGRDPIAIETVCENLVREQLWLTAARRPGGLVSPGREYAFAHGLFRHVLYESMPPLARARLHLKVADALESERSAGVPVAAAELAMHYDRGGEPIRALERYAEAADAALTNRSPAECKSLTERALTLLEQTAAGPERDHVELALQTLDGVAAMHVAGFGEATRAAFDRACHLLEANPGHPMRRRLVRGYTMALSMRAEYDAALAVAGRVAKFMAGPEDLWSQRASVAVEAQTLMMQGRPASALRRIEAGAPGGEPLDNAALPASAADPQLSLLAMQSLLMLHLGLVERGRASLQQAYESARRFAQPMALMVATWFDALFELRLDNVRRVAELADELHALADDFALAQGRTAWRWFHGWALARTGSPLEGFRWIREATDENMSIGMLAGSTENLGYAAEALLLAGDLGGAQAQIDEAMTLVDRLGERIYLPQLLLTAAAIARATGRRDAAEQAMRRAIAESREQAAPWLELTSVLALCESNLAGSADRAALESIVERIPEAAGTQPVVRARAWLEAARH